jgi:uncharacterized protein with von Willebrand factor type A (vWA) domain
VTAPAREVRAKLQGNPKLRKILKLAGRMKSAAAQKQRSKATPGREELCDVTQGDDIARLVPTELINLASPETELLLFRRLMERTAMVYELRGKVHVSEGPIVMAVDESGSMSGERDEWAKAVALALMEIAARQNRPFVYMHFSTSVTRIDEFPAPRSLTLAQIEELATHFSSGGTSIAAALQAAAELLDRGATSRVVTGSKPWKRADVILVTDGDDYDAEGMTAAIMKIRKLGGHLYTVLIDTEADHDSPIVALADERMAITRADITTGDPTKLGAMFSM